MSQAKANFIKSLQQTDRLLWPFDISQLIRRQFSWICLYRADPELDPALIRGYMVRPHSNRAHSADDPAEFWCVIASNQTMGWQNLVWTKEMLQALDSEGALTTDPAKLGDVLDMCEVEEPNGDDTPPHIVADKNGFTLALGCAVPFFYRKEIRKTIVDTGRLDPLVRANLVSFVPDEYVDNLLEQDFEDKFELALPRFSRLDNLF